MKNRFLAAWVLALSLATTPLGASERPLTLEEAIVRALEMNEGIVIERETLDSARSAEQGAKGAYDPKVELRSEWRRTTAPANSAFSGAPAGEDSPTSDAAGAMGSIRQLLPTGGEIALSATGLRGTTDDAFTLLSPAFTTRLGIEARQPLLRDRATDAARTAIRITASDRRRAAASLRVEISGTLAAVESAYWTLVAARREVTVREEAVRLADEQLEETRIRSEKGAVPETEIAQPRAELERRRDELFASREAVSRAESALKLLILGDAGAAWSDSLAPVDDPDVQPVAPEVGEAMELALASRPELEASMAVLERRRSETALALDEVRPTLDAFASYDRFGLSGSSNPAATAVPGLPSGVPDGMGGEWGRSFGMLGEDRFNDTRIGLEFRIPVGNRSAQGNAAVARSAERQAEADLSRARKLVRAEVLDAAAALQTAGQRIEASRSAREAAEVQLNSEQERYASGLSTNFLVLTRQNDLSRARLDEIAALTDYRKARTEMARATGALLEARRIEIDESGIAEGS